VGECFFSMVKAHPARETVVVAGTALNETNNSSSARQTVNHHSPVLVIWSAVSLSSRIVVSSGVRTAVAELTVFVDVEAVFSGLGARRKPAQVDCYCDVARRRLHIKAPSIRNTPLKASPWRETGQLSPPTNLRSRSRDYHKIV